MPRKNHSGTGESGQGGGTIAQRMRTLAIRAFETTCETGDTQSVPIEVARACKAVVKHGAETCRLVALTVMVAAGIP